MDTSRVESQLSLHHHDPALAMATDTVTIETFIDNDDDYQSLLQAVSNIRISPSQPREDSAHSDTPFETIHHEGGRAYSDQELDNGSYETQDNPEDVCTNPPRTAIENIYDMRHIMIHHHLGLEAQLRQVETQGQETTGTPEDCSHEVSSPEIIRPGTRVSSATAQDAYLVEQQHSDDAEMGTIFGSRSTIPSSYFSRQQVIQNQNDVIERIQTNPQGRTQANFLWSTSSLSQPSLGTNRRNYIYPHYATSVTASDSGMYQPTSYSGRNVFHRPNMRHGPSSTWSWSDSSIERRTRSTVGRKEVVRMACRFCESIICERGMKASRRRVRRQAMFMSSRFKVLSH